MLDRVFICDFLVQGPVKWMAPESIGDREYSPASDVWMFGILCVEVITEKVPHEGMDNLEGMAFKLKFIEVASSNARVSLFQLP